MTAALESLHKTYPGKYITDVDVSVPACFAHNPWVTKLDRKDETVRQITMHYPVSDSDKRPIHFMEGFCEYLGGQLKVPLKCMVNHPVLYLTQEEKKWQSAVEEHAKFKGRYWLINAGWKNDYTVKKWKLSYFQEVVNHFLGRIQFVQVGEKHQNHPLLDNVINFVGKWDRDARALIRLAYHASGALTAESFLGHIMAAFKKPCVVLASGLFPVGWIHYPTSKIISYQQSMSCCTNLGACWKSRIRPKDDKDTSLCLLPVLDDDPRGRCMDMIRPDEVIRAIDNYFLGGVCTY